VMDSPIWGMTTSVGMNFSSPSVTDTDGQNPLVPAGCAVEHTHR
jgi:hypothetical protein